MPETPHTVVTSVTVAQPETHYVDIESRFPALRAADEFVDDSSGSVSLISMAVWTPGSYLVREFARHVEAVQAFDADSGDPLDIEAVGKNRWAVDADGRSFVVRYRLYCRELTVRTNFVDSEFMLLNGASTFLKPVEGEFDYEIRLDLPQAWTRCETALPEIDRDEGSLHCYRARDYDHLVDSPIYAGNAEVRDFEVDGIAHRLVDDGGGPGWDLDRVAADVEQIVRGHARFWDGLPYERFVFINLLGTAAGGLEHCDSTVLMARRHKVLTPQGYRDWLGLVSHELFHAWNGKRLRPRELGPFDYENEVFTTGLWAVEGLTSYYDHLLLARAGLFEAEQFLSALSRDIRRLQTAPGRNVQSLVASSNAAWIKQYRRDENSDNSAISYYVKGSVVGFLLDARLRLASNNARSLDDLMKLAWRRFSGERGFTEAEWLAMVEEIGDRAVAEWLRATLHSTDELDYGPGLNAFGLCFGDQDANKKQPERTPGWLGCETAIVGGQTVVKEVRRETPARTAGLNVGDEILAIDGYRVPPRGLKRRLAGYRPGDQVRLLVSRRERIRSLKAVLGEAPVDCWELARSDNATDAQREWFVSWVEFVESN